MLAYRSRQAERNLALVRPGEFVFTRPNGHPYGRGVASTSLKRAARAAGLNEPGLPPLGCHDLRHSCIAIALERGATPVEAAELARHGDVQSTCGRTPV